MRVWRISKAIYAQKSFSGDGGLKAAARWHHKGHRIVYTSESLSLATLELWVHINPEEPLTSYVATAAEIPDEFTVHLFEASTLPAGWREYPSPPALREKGTEWLESRRTPVARVPSAITPGEFNLLLNPEHPDWERICIDDPIPFIFDGRMWKHR